MDTQKSIFKDKGLVAGLILILLSFGMYLTLSIQTEHTSPALFENEGIYFINYILALGYFIRYFFIPFFGNWFKYTNYSYQHFICSLILLSISCFTINITMPFFSKFGTWMDIYLIAMHLSLLAICFNDRIPQILRIANFFVLGLGAILSLYFTIHLMPLSVAGIIGMILFGLGIHFLAPAIFLATVITQFLQKSKTGAERIAFYAGAVLPLIILTIFVFKWNATKNLIHETQATIITRPDNTLPSWVLLSQKLGDDFITQRILKGDLTYETSVFSNSSFGRGMGNSLNEVKEHDPLVVIGSALMGTINLDKEDRIKILESQYDLRHQTKRKLWSGKHLITSSVLTNTQVFPDYRLAYTEKIIKIKNNYPSHRWNRQEEALYTFHLPEGSVATSLSLWIDGKEEKSRLTTKSKADNAYKTIVGVERRDPSILHWQEGNTITVYVFPCTPAEERMFKIGITSPMKYEKDQLVLANIYFDGPDASDALETSIVEFKSKTRVPIKANMPGHFDKITDYKYQYTGNYKPFWEASCNTIPLSDLPFSFHGKSYRIAETDIQTKPTAIQSVYLDINASWSRAEFDAVWSVVKDKKVWVHYDQLLALTADNKADYFELLQALNFSLFPLNKIEVPEQSLLISKSPTVAPMLKDLKGSAFIHELKGFLAERETRINLFCLSDELTPYLKTLKEFQVFNYAKGDTKYLQALLKKGSFINDARDANTIALSIANTVIKRDNSDVPSKAPDHLMRLFAYNKIMKDCGRNYFTNGPYVKNSLIDIANEAYIVSPISSLIVLESIKDYDRFDIGENKNSLKNASTKSAGAVPEPHEWALIILLSATLCFLYYKRIFNQENA